MALALLNGASALRTSDPIVGLCGRSMAVLPAPWPLGPKTLPLPEESMVRGAPEPAELGGDNRVDEGLDT
ncbi:hypothetical protein Tdes44962_MAKER02203 [Teratosphaeria destructans]|uniref:Uncharacterized protein n=1 Tax=Teratosphaeria destructans TaxID=418781 RepID=A0A9W7W3C5_9PEZI|nr:hypothetical protein Tdes44962_MAKER02203 [Teratosphaeria destructans]